MYKSTIKRGRTLCCFVVVLFIICFQAISMATADYNRDLIKAANDGNLDAVTLLLSKGADVNAKKSDGSTALIEASFHGHKDVVTLLLSKGADVNAKQSDGSTAMYWASLGGQKDVVHCF